MKRIVISGACGFLGRNIIQRALEEDLPVLALPTFPERLNGIPVEIASIERFLHSDISFTRDDVFINCLFPTNADGLRMADGLRVVYQTIYTAKESGIGAFINISSQSVYASTRTEPAKETDSLCLETPYAVGKYSSEAFTNYIFQNTSHTSIRMASLLGVGYDQRIVNRMIIQALRGQTLTVMGGMQRYGFLDVRDAAAGLVRLAMSDPNRWQAVYNLGRIEYYSLLDIVDCLSKQIYQLTGRTVDVQIDDGNDTRNSAIDASRFMAEFDWQPEITLSKTVEEIIADKCKLSGVHNL